MRRLIPYNFCVAIQNYEKVVSFLNFYPHKIELHPTKLKEYHLEGLAKLIEVLLFPTKENILHLLESMKNMPNHQFKALFSWKVGILKIIFADFEYPYSKAQIEPTIQKVKALDLQDYEEYPESINEKNIYFILAIYGLEIGSDLSLSAEEYLNLYQKYKGLNNLDLIELLSYINEDVVNADIEKIAISLFDDIQDDWQKAYKFTILVSKLSISTLDNYLQQNKENIISYCEYLIDDFHIKKETFKKLSEIFSLQLLQKQESSVIVLLLAALISEKRIINNDNIHIFTIPLEQLIAFPFENKYNQVYRILLILIHKDYGITYEKEILALVEELSIFKETFLQKDNRSVFYNIFQTFRTFLLYEKHHISILLKIYEWIPQDIEHQNIIWWFEYTIRSISSRMPVKLNDKERMKELGFEEYLIADEVF